MSTFDPGRVIGAVGNTGNSSEPHLHFQLMDDPRPTARPPCSIARQPRFIVRADDFDHALVFYRDTFGLPEQAAFSGDGDALVAVLEAGRATLGLANPRAARHDRPDRNR